MNEFMKNPISFEVTYNFYDRCYRRFNHRAILKSIIFLIALLILISCTENQRPSVFDSSLPDDLKYVISSFLRAKQLGGQEYQKGFTVTIGYLKRYPADPRALYLAGWGALGLSEQETSISFMESALKNGLSGNQKRLSDNYMKSYKMADKSILFKGKLMPYTYLVGMLDDFRALYPELPAQFDSDDLILKYFDQHEYRNYLESVFSKSSSKLSNTDLAILINFPYQSYDDLEEVFRSFFTIEIEFGGQIGNSSASYALNEARNKLALKYQKWIHYSPYSKWLRHHSF